MPNSIARRALASFTGKLLSAPVITASLLFAIPASAQQAALSSASGQAIYGPPAQITAMFTDADALAGMLRRQGVADAEAAAVENGVRKALSASQRKAGALVELHFSGHYGARNLDRISIEPAKGAAVSLTRNALGLPPATATTTTTATATATTTETTTATAAAPAPQPATPAAAKPAEPAPQPTATPQAARVGTSGGAAPAVMAPSPVASNKHAAVPGYARVTGIVAGDTVAALRQAGVPRGVAEQAQTAARLHPRLKNASLDGSRFEIVYDPSFDANAGFSLAAFTVSGHEHRVWRFQPTDAPPGLFTDHGERLTGIVLRSPMPGVEINSPYGMRKHPVLRVAKFHWGVDFPAPHGTPIIAAADGIVTAAKRYGNYGLYMHIDHGEGVATTYGHMSRFATGMKPGTKVKAGDVIAHIGRTGLATGPHLYFEVFIGERRVDPEPLIAAGGRQLFGADQMAFERVRQQSGATEIASESRN